MIACSVYVAHCSADCPALCVRPLSLGTQYRVSSQHAPQTSSQPAKHPYVQPPRRDRHRQRHRRTRQKGTWHISLGFSDCGYPGEFRSPKLRVAFYAAWQISRHIHLQARHATPPHCLPPRSPLSRDTSGLFDIHMQGSRDTRSFDYFSNATQQRVVNCERYV
jgi:hypothetical protein